MIDRRDREDDACHDQNDTEDQCAFECRPPALVSEDLALFDAEHAPHHQVHKDGEGAHGRENEVDGSEESLSNESHNLPLM